MKYLWRYCRVHLLLIVLIGMTGAVGAADTPQEPVPSMRSLWIISSSNNRFFRRSIRRIEERMAAHVDRIVKIHSDEIEQRRDDLAQASLIVTLGARAMRQISAMDLDRPLLHAYLTRYQYLSDPPLPGSHSLLLDQPLERHLRFNRELTGARNIGLLNVKMTAWDTEQLQQLARSEGVEVEQKLIDPEQGNPVAEVRKILQNNDNLLALPVPVLYNRKTLKGILLAAYRLRKPVLSYSPAHVRAGALGALYATPEQIGDQIADVALPWLQGQAPTTAHELARYFAIDINRQVATALGIRPPSAEQLQQAIEDAIQP